MLGKDEDGDVSFGEWEDQDPLPIYQDHITGFNLVSPPDDTSDSTTDKPGTWPRHYPSDPAFGPPSVVGVVQPWLESWRHLALRTLWFLFFRKKGGTFRKSSG